MSETDTDDARLGTGVEQEDELTIHHTGEQDFHDKSVGDFVTRQTVEVRCPTMDDCRDVGRVVSLLNRHDAEEIVEAVEGDDV